MSLAASRRRVLSIALALAALGGFGLFWSLPANVGKKHPPPAFTQSATATREDYLVFQAAIADFVDHGKQGPVGWTFHEDWQGGRGRVVVDAVAGGKMHVLVGDELGCEWGDCVGSAYLVGQLHRRSQHVVMLEPGQLDAGSTAVHDLAHARNAPYLDDFDSDVLDSLQKQYPDAMAFVHTFLPGYSADGQKALVFFQFYFQDHSVFAFIHVDKQNGKWRAKWRQFTYTI